MEVGLQRVALGDAHELWLGALPESVLPGECGFERLWDARPRDFHVVRMHGRAVPTPRWQQAFGRDYVYSGNVNRALPISPELQPYLDWACSAIDPRLNSLLLNWYDGALGHYIGRHRDATAPMIDGSPIVTLSLGEERVFRLRPYRGQNKTDVVVAHGAVVVIPFATNLAWTHEVPHFKRYQGRRVSLTLRAFV